MRPTAKAGIRSQPPVAAARSTASTSFARPSSVRVDAVAVGGLHEEHVGLRQGLRIAHDRHAVAAEVAGEDDEPAADPAARPAPRPGCGRRGRSAPRRPAPARSTRRTRPGASRPSARSASAPREQRQRGRVPRRPVPVGVRGLFLLRGAPASGSITRSSSAVPRVQNTGPAKPSRDEPRQVAGVIDVRVAQEHRREALLGRAGGGVQLRWRSGFSPWNSPQSRSSGRRVRPRGGASSP